MMLFPPRRKVRMKEVGLRIHPRRKAQTNEEGKMKRKGKVIAISSQN